MREDSFIKDNVFYQNIDNFEGIIENVEQDKRRFVEDTFKKNFIITLYTLWENSIKDVLFEHLTNNVDSIFDERFIKTFYSTILNSTNHVKEEYLSSLNNRNILIKKEYYLSTNNLWFDNLVELIKRLYTEATKDDLLMYARKNTKLQECIKILEKSVISKFSKKTTNPEGFEGYIDSLVNNRNSLAHAGSCDEYVNIADMKHFFEFINNAILLIKKYLQNLYIARLASERLCTNISHVHLESSSMNSGIIELTFDSNQVKFINELDIFESSWYVRNNNQFFPITVHNVKDEKQCSITKLPENGHVTFEVSSDFVKIIRRSNIYQLLNLKYLENETLSGTEKVLEFHF